MLRNISRELSTLLAAKKIISIENVDAYAYGLELFLFKSVFYLLVFILSLLSGTLLISALFVIIYLILVGIYLFRVEEVAIVIELFSTISCVVISIFAPVENKNKMLDKTEKKKYHLVSILLSLLVLVISTIAFLANWYWVFYPSAYSLTATAVMILISLGRCKK